MSKAVTKEQLSDCLERIGDYFIQTNEPFTGAGESVAGAMGMVPAPSAGDEDKVLFGNGTWGLVTNALTDLVQQVTVTIYNKFVVSGCIVKAVANSRNIQLTETGTSSSTGRSTFFADGGIHTITDGKTAAVPTNTTSAAVTYYACLVKNSSTGVYELKVQTSKTGVLSLYRITVPTSDTASNLNSVTITDERRVETSYGQFYASRPYASVALAKAFSSASYDISLRAVSWDGGPVGQLYAYDLANNGFKVAATGDADNIELRATIINPDV